MKLIPPEDIDKPFDGCEKAITSVKVFYPCKGSYAAVDITVNCWDFDGESYLSGKTISFLDLVKAYYWHKNNPPITNEDIFEGLNRLYNVLDENKMILPHLRLDQIFLQYPFMETLMYRAIIDSTNINFNGSTKELLDEVYDNWL